MKKLNIIKWILARFKRTSSNDHMVEVVVYLDGRIIERREQHIDENFVRRGSLYYNAILFANGVISMALGLERRRMKGRA